MTPSEVDELVAAKIGPAFGLRREPQVRRVAGHRWWWTASAGPFKTERAARRMARKLRGRARKHRCFGVWQEPRRQVAGRREWRKTRDWWVMHMRGKRGRR